MGLVPASFILPVPFTRGGYTELEDAQVSSHGVFLLA